MQETAARGLSCNFCFQVPCQGRLFACAATSPDHVVYWGCLCAALGGPALQETARAADAARNAIAKSAGGTFQELQEQPAFLSAGNLRQYQLEGLNWLTYAWLKVRMHSLHLPLPTCTESEHA